jgi:hypothetical protein
VLCLKISEVTIQDLKEYAHEDNDDPEVIKNFSNILVGAKAYIKSYTGLSYEQMDTKEDLTLVVYVLCSEMYDNRQYTVDKANVNPVIKSILDMHSVNLL